jgi:hypothetical protein
MTSTKAWPVRESLCLRTIAVISMRKDSRSPLVPLGEDVADGVGVHAQRALHEVVGLGDDLHVGVLDAVVDHLHEVAGAVRAHVGAAGGAVDVRGDLLEHRAEAVVGLDGAAGHDRGAVEGALLTAGDARAHEVQALLAQRVLATTGVGEQRVAAVHDDVALVHVLGELVDDGVGGAAGLHHDDRHARLLQGVDEVLGGLGGEELALVLVVVVHGLGLGDRAVVDRDLEAVAREVAGEVGPHHRHAGHADVGDVRGRRFEAGHGCAPCIECGLPACGRTARPGAARNGPRARPEGTCACRRAHCRDAARSLRCRARACRDRRHAARRRPSAPPTDERGTTITRPPGSVVPARRPQTPPLRRTIDP